MQLQAGTILRDYKIEDLLGEGGMGTVYLAKDSVNDRYVAIKELNLILKADSELVKRFRNEAKLQAKLSHENIVSLYSFFEQDGRYYMAMEYAEGRTLKEVIRKTGPIPEARAISILKQVVSALKYAHDMGIIHRDIKPSNIILDDNDQIKILDFGIARVVGERGLTQTGQQIGTLAYMSPEQVRSEKDIDGKTDVYSLGVTLFEMLSGRMLYDLDSQSDYAIMISIVETPLPDPRDHYPYISDSTIELLARMTEKEVDERADITEIECCLRDHNDAEVLEKSKEDEDENEDEDEIWEEAVELAEDVEEEEELPEDSHSELNHYIYQDILEKLRRINVVMNVEKLDDIVRNVEELEDTAEDEPLEQKVKETGYISPLWFIALIVLILLGIGVLLKSFIAINRDDDYVSGSYEEDLVNSMIFVEGGTFMMGSSDGYDDEKPIHEVSLSSFMISQYEVTQKEWLEVMGSNPSSFKGSHRPVENVSWHDAIDYCNKRSVKEGLTPCYSGSGNNIACNWDANGYRLPTEAEWEYAARGGNKSSGYEYAGSNTLSDVAWYYGNSGDKTHQVGQKSPNELGIYDMSGNVREWCWDWYGESFYEKSPIRDPRGSTSWRGRVLRGGSWKSRLDLYCMVAYRSTNTPIVASNGSGFRVVRTFK
ncbi:MAG TPA: SUMF1/EgtB/PvdO family nonheme iron enzyme [Candidatus Cloacimonetes bacterium]|nr:SUMF1/EgtB/PvdO family nonheme iron enzyme [Candidatus Cloacimonadota bacterium]